MNPTSIFVVAVSLACLSWGSFAAAEEKPSAAAAVSIAGMAPDAFDKLSDDAVIEFDGQRMTKKAFVAQRTMVIRRMEEAQKAIARATEFFRAQRSAFLASQDAKLKDANAKTQLYIDRELTALAALRGPDWEGKKEQALKLLDQASDASAVDQPQLVRQALELLRLPTQNP
jgi:hypothetical protein